MFSGRSVLFPGRAVTRFADVTEMHRAASRFAVATIDAAVAGDVKPALAALSDVTRQCLACHSGFRVQ